MVKEKHIPMVFIPLIALVFIIGCVSIEEREATIKQQYPQWDENTVKEVARRQITPGMTPEMVTAAMGRKGEIKSGAAFGEQKWIYYGETGASQASFFAPVFIVYFNNGKVTSVEGNPERANTW